MKADKQIVSRRIFFIEGFTVEGNADEYLDFPGYAIEGQYWNGSSMPLFEKESADRVVAAYMAQCNNPESQSVPEIAQSWMRYDETKDAYIHHDEQFASDPGYADEEWPGFDVITVDGPKHVYAIASGFWTWQELDKEDK